MTERTKKEIGEIILAYLCSSSIFFCGGYKTKDWPLSLLEWVLILFTTLVLYALMLWLLRGRPHIEEAEQNPAAP